MPDAASAASPAAGGVCSRTAEYSPSMSIPGTSCTGSPSKGSRKTGAELGSIPCNSAEGPRAAS